MSMQKDRSICKRKAWRFFCSKPSFKDSDAFFVSVIINRAKKRYDQYTQARLTPYLETQICGAIGYLLRVESNFSHILKSKGLLDEFKELIRQFQTIKEKKFQNAA